MIFSLSPESLSFSIDTESGPLDCAFHQAPVSKGMASVELDERLDEDALDLAENCDVADMAGEAGWLLRLKGLWRDFNEETTLPAE